MNDKGDDGVFRTGEIDISRGPVDVSVEVTSQRGVDKGDYVRLYQIGDGGNEKLVGEVRGKHSEPTTIQGTSNGRLLTIVIRASVSSEDEVFLIDNLSIDFR